MIPFVVVRVNMAITTEQELELKTRLGQAIGLVPGKSEEHLLVGIEDKCRLFLVGDGQTPLVYLEVSVFGNEAHAGYAAFTKAATQSLQDVGGIVPDHVYLRFSDVAAWGVSGRYVDRRMLG
ncbi:MAG: phenylpyruvate tautomerase MIF-related protein [Coriobacteriales bacterium]|nr:phenylpyruvate tautomerase MIF-related protein [Coriobacteriales bacterium]